MMRPLARLAVLVCRLSFIVFLLRLRLVFQTVLVEPTSRADRSSEPTVPADRSSRLFEPTDRTNRSSRPDRSNRPLEPTVRTDHSESWFPNQGSTFPPLQGVGGLREAL